MIMPLRPEMKLRETMSPAAQRVHKRIQKACSGALNADVLMALLLEYSEVLLFACADFEQHQRNVAFALEALEANARAYFKRQN